MPNLDDTQAFIEAATRRLFQLYAKRFERAFPDYSGPMHHLVWVPAADGAVAEQLAAAFAARPVNGPDYAAQYSLKPFEARLLLAAAGRALEGEVEARGGCVGLVREGRGYDLQKDDLEGLVASFA